MLLWALLGAALAVWAYGLNAVQRWRHRHLPGPRPAWLLGNLPAMTRRQSMGLTPWTTQYGTIYVWFLGRIPCIVLSDPELIREVGTKLFVSCFHDRALPTLALGSAADREFTARGMLFARKKYWKRLRAACEPMFHRGALASYMPLLHRAADALEATLAGAAASGASLNVADALAGTTMDVIGETAFGVEFHAQEAAAGGQPEILTASKRIFAPFGGVGRGLAVLFYAAPAFARAWAWLARALGSARVREVEASRGYLWGAAHALLHNSRAAGRAAAAGAPPPPAGPADAPEPLPQLHPAQAAAFQRALRDYAHVVPPSTSVIHRLRHAVNLDSGLPLSDADICAQSFTLMLAGYETTSLAISYALYELAKAPDLQARVAAEVAAVCANGGGEGGGGGTRRLAFADLGRLELTEAVFNEAMRMWPPVTPVLALAREAAAECAVGGWRVPRGARVQFDVHSMHHDPRHFPDPQEFRPERFMRGSPEAAARHPYAFLPFGLGPRKCLGYRLATEEGVLVLARLLARFEFSLDGERHAGPLDVRSAITMAPRDGIWLRARERGAGE